MRCSQQTMKSAAMTITVLLLALGGVVRARADFVQNGNFDANSPPGGTAPLDWTFTPAASGSDFFVGPGPGFGAFSTPNSANFGATGAFDDTLSQILATTPGASYTLTYQLADDDDSGENDFSASWGGVVIPGSVLVNAADFPYTEYSFDLTATSGSTTLSFSGLNVPAWYDLDNVSVTQDSSVAPEPSSFLLLGLGAAGLIGYIGLRRRMKLAVAA
ncbi:MAG TPA: PEP-CTERM sorting domain-containing protein [Gemmataceae bacterium]|nr:PEP-CTERM sorting domain-containing protein [Gemmataceae bacterium]